MEWNDDKYYGSAFGTTYEDYPNIALLKELGVNTIALSVSDLGKENWDIIGAPEKLRVDLNHLCKFIKDQGFNLRLSLNLTNKFDNKILDLFIRQQYYGNASVQSE